METPTTEQSTRRNRRKTNTPRKKEAVSPDVRNEGLVQESQPQENSTTTDTNNNNQSQNAKESELESEKKEKEDELENEKEKEKEKEVLDKTETWPGLSVNRLYILKTEEDYTLRGLLEEERRQQRKKQRLEKEMQEEVERQSQSLEIEEMLEKASKVLMHVQTDEELDDTMLKGNAEFVRQLVVERLQWLRDTDDTLTEEDLALAKEHLMAQIENKVRRIQRRRKRKREAKNKITIDVLDSDSDQEETNNKGT